MPSFMKMLRINSCPAPKETSVPISRFLSIMSIVSEPTIENEAIIITISTIVNIPHFSYFIIL